MSVEVEIKGLKELGEALKQMPQRLAGRALGASVKAGADLVQNTAREMARGVFKDPTGATEKSIVAYRAKRSRPDNITYEVGVTMKKKWPRRKRTKANFKGIFKVRDVGSQMIDKNQPAYWWRFTEFGTSKVVARPWLRPAWVHTQRASLWMITKMLEKAVVIAAAQVPKYRG